MCTCVPVRVCNFIDAWKYVCKHVYSCMSCLRIYAHGVRCVAVNRGVVARAIHSTWPSVLQAQAVHSSSLTLRRPTALAHRANTKRQWDPMPPGKTLWGAGGKRARRQRAPANSDNCVHTLLQQ